MSGTNHITICNIDQNTSSHRVHEFNIHAIERGGTAELNQSISRSELERLAQGDTLYGYTLDTENDLRSLEILEDALSLEG